MNHQASRAEYQTDQGEAGSDPTTGTPKQEIERLTRMLRMQTDASEHLHNRLLRSSRNQRQHRTLSMIQGLLGVDLEPTNTPRAQLDRATQALRMIVNYLEEDLDIREYETSQGDKELPPMTADFKGY